MLDHEFWFRNSSHRDQNVTLHGWEAPRRTAGGQPFDYLANGRLLGRYLAPDLSSALRNGTHTMALLMGKLSYKFRREKAAAKGALWVEGGRWR